MSASPAVVHSFICMSFISIDGLMVVKTARDVVVVVFVVVGGGGGVSPSTHSHVVSGREPDSFQNQLLCQFLSHCHYILQVSRKLLAHYSRRKKTKHALYVE